MAHPLEGTNVPLETVGVGSLADHGARRVATSPLPGQQGAVHGATLDVHGGSCPLPCPDGSPGACRLTGA